MTLTTVPVPAGRRPELEAMAKGYYAELLPNGPLFHPRMIDPYWGQRGRHPYLIELDGTPIGFALVWTHPDGTHELAEFTIQPSHRHQGLGSQAARMIFEALGGDWTLGVATHSPGGLPFWQNCLEHFDKAFEIVQGPPKTPHQSGSFTFRIGNLP